MLIPLISQQPNKVDTITNPIKKKTLKYRDF